MVAAGVTLFDVMPVTVPTPWLIDRLVAPLTLQDSVLDAPLVMLVGEAVKEEITGGSGCGAAALTVTLAVFVTEPAAFVAVSV